MFSKYNDMLLMLKVVVRLRVAVNIFRFTVIIMILFLMSLPSSFKAEAQFNRRKNVSSGQYIFQKSGFKVFLPLISRPITISGPLTAASESEFRYDVFSVGSIGADPSDNDHVIQFWYDNGWYVADLGAVPLTIGGGGFAGQISAASWGPGRYDIFGVGQNGHIVQLWYNGAWHWADLGTMPDVNVESFADTITATSDGLGRYMIFGVDERPGHHNIVQFWYDGMWHWTDLGSIPSNIDGGDLSVRITAASWKSGRYDVFGIASDSNLRDHVFQLWYNGMWHWSDLGSIPSDIGGGHVSGRIAAASWGTGRYDVFGVGWNSHVIQLWYDGVWHWADLGAAPPDIGGGGFAYPSPITAASWGLGRYDVFDVGRNGHIIQFWYDDAWHWADLRLTS